MGKTALEKVREKLPVGDPDHCWEWPAARNQKGYGMLFEYVGIEQKTRKAHRVAYELFVGPVPDGMFVCHRCDNPPCCNPAHLFLGTAQDNMDDAMAKQRRPHLPRKLSAAQARAIRADPRVARVIAAEFGLSVTTVYAIKTGKAWRHLPDEAA